MVVEAIVSEEGITKGKIYDVIEENDYGSCFKIITDNGVMGFRNKCLFRIVNDINRKRINAQNILMTDMSDDMKLYEVFKIYKEDLKNSYSQLYYALLAWKDKHLKELLEEESSYK